MDATYPLFIREELLYQTRAYFRTNHFQELTTPVLSEAVPLEPNIHPFETIWHMPREDRKMYLATSPENMVKKLMVHNMQNYFSIGHCFRNLESAGTKHSPEFLMLEWYRTHATYMDILNDVKPFIIAMKQGIDRYLHRDPSTEIHYQGNTIKLDTKWPIFSLVDLYQQYAGLDVAQVMTDDALKEISKQKGYSIDNTTWSALFDQIYLNEIEPHMPASPHFIIDFPARTSPMCKAKKDAPHLAERFEIYMAGIELGNGNTENTDIQSMKDIFMGEQQSRADNGISSPHVDDGFLNALQSMDGETFAGIGLGIDRLAMILADVPDLHDVLIA